MRIFRAIGLSVALAATASAASADMIEVDERGIAKSPFYNAQGEQLDAIPVMIRKTDDGKAEIVAFRVDAASSDYADYDNPGILATWSVDATVAEGIGFNFGVILGRVGCGETTFKGLCGGDGILMQVGVHTEAVRASLGYAMVIGLGDGSHTHGGLIMPITGVAMKATVIKTLEGADGWGGVLSPSPDALYAGAEIDFTLFMKFSVGLFRRVSANQELLDLGAEDSEWLLNFGTGIGF